MSCYICGAAIDEPKLDPRDMKTMPCSTCEQVIQDTIDSYPREGDPDDYVVYLDPDDIYAFHPAPRGLQAVERDY